MHENRASIYVRWIRSRSCVVRGGNGTASIVDAMAEASACTPGSMAVSAIEP